MGSAVPVVIYPFYGDEIIKRTQREGGTIGERTAGTAAKLAMAMDIKAVREKMEVQQVGGNITAYADNIIYMGEVADVFAMRNIIRPASAVLPDSTFC